MRCFRNQLPKVSMCQRVIQASGFPDKSVHRIFLCFSIYGATKEEFCRSRRCIIILKKDGGSTNSMLRHWTTPFYSFARFTGSISFREIALRNAHIFTVANRTLSSRIPLSATRSNCIISMWQPWCFRYKNFLSATFIVPFTFEEKPIGPWYCIGIRTCCPSLDF